MTFSLAEESVNRLLELRPRCKVPVSINHTVISGQSMADHQLLMERFEPCDVDVHDGAGLQRLGDVQLQAVRQEGD